MARINHVALKVTDLETATRFYENVYGFRQVGTGRSRGHISRHMTDGYVDLALMVYDSEDDAEAKMVGPGPAIHHFGIEVEDHEGFAEKVVANGGTILSKPGESPDQIPLARRHRRRDRAAGALPEDAGAQRRRIAPPTAGPPRGARLTCCFWRRRVRPLTSSAFPGGRWSCWRQRARPRDWETRSRRFHAARHMWSTSPCRSSGRRPIA